GGLWEGRSSRFFGPTCYRVGSSPVAERCIMYRFPPPRLPTDRRRIPLYSFPTRRSSDLGAIASLFDRCSLTVSICPPTPNRKIPPHRPPHQIRSALLPPSCPPTGEY